MLLILLIKCVSIVLAFPKPEPGYSQGYLTIGGNSGYSTNYNQVPYDTTGYSQSNNNNYHPNEESQEVTIQQSQGFDLEHSTYDSEQDMMNGFPSHQYLQENQQQNNNFNSHQSFNSIAQDQDRFENREITGEGIIEPKIAEPSGQYAPPKMDEPSSRYIPPQPKIINSLSSNRYVPPKEPKKHYIPPPTTPPAQGLIAPENSYIPPQQDQHSSYQPMRYISSSGYGYPSRPIVQKHIYVHVPPKDFDDELPPQNIQVPQAQKHYKIIFIKAPSPPAYQPPIIPPIPQNEEKTLIYVLHKKPEELDDLTIPTPEPTQPSKPEVYFIKYKTHKSQNGLYGAPPSAPSDNASAAGYGEAQHKQQTLSNLETESNSQTEQYRESTFVTSPNHQNTTPRSSSSYGPPLKTY